MQRSCLFGSDQEESKTEDLLNKYKTEYRFQCEIIEEIIQHEMKLRYQSFRIDKIEESIFLTKLKSQINKVDSELNKKNLGG